MAYDKSARESRALSRRASSKCAPRRLAPSKFAPRKSRPSSLQSFKLIPGLGRIAQSGEMSTEGLGKNHKPITAATPDSAITATSKTVCLRYCGAAARSAPATARRQVALRASLIAFAILCGGALIGGWLLRQLGIGLSIAYAILGLPLVGAGIGWLIDRATGVQGVWVGPLVLVGAAAGVAMAVVLLGKSNRTL